MLLARPFAWKDSGDSPNASGPNPRSLEGLQEEARRVPEIAIDRGLVSLGLVLQVTLSELVKP